MGRQEKKKTYQVIVDKITAFFLNGNLQPGDKLPPERELAAQFKVSRTSIREALRLMEMNGIIEIRQGGGSFIKTTDLQLISQDFTSTMLKAENNLVYEMLELRRALEVDSAYLAAQRATAQDLVKLRESLEMMAISIHDVELGIKADLDFHIGIVEATHNSIFIELIQTLSEHMKDTIRATRKHRFMDPRRYGDTMDEHKEIYLAIASGNSNKAKQLMEEHITRIREELTESIVSDIGK